MREYEFSITDTLAGVDAGQWDALAGGNPTLSHAFLQSMIDAGCTGAQTGWQPQFLLLARGEPQAMLTGAVPLYVKTHSYGEYVFDWAWAEAYERNGLDYYPKLLAAVPFTPCTGSRLLARTAADRELLVAQLLRLARDSPVSSLHVLFAEESEQRLLVGAGMMARVSVQFHWRNPGYTDFEAFLATLNHDKRKRIRQERRKLREAGVQLRVLPGEAIGAAEWDFFFDCYRRTYLAHRSTPYLNREFFGLIGRRMSQQLMMVVAQLQGTPIATALNLVGADTLYGRYWGATQYVPGLHFEACYYQAIEYAIAHGIGTIEGGAQGEHKLARGFLPVQCHSAHWLVHPEFSAAVDRFLSREGAAIGRYVDELHDSSPFRRG